MKFMKNSNKITSSLSLPSLVILPHRFFFSLFLYGGLHCICMLCVPL